MMDADIALMKSNPKAWVFFFLMFLNRYFINSASISDVYTLSKFVDEFLYSFNFQNIFTFNQQVHRKGHVD